MRGEAIRRVFVVLGVLLLAGVALVLGVSSARSDVAGTYTVHNLSSDVPGLAAHLDPDLQNGWGIAEPTSGPWWVADNGTDKSTLYAADGTKQGLVVQITNGAPTGTVFNGGSGFVVSANGKSGPARFIFASESGTISGWNPTVDGTHTVVAAMTAGTVYKGSHWRMLRAVSSCMRRLRRRPRRRLQLVARARRRLGRLRRPATPGRLRTVRDRRRERDAGGHVRQAAARQRGRGAPPGLRRRRCLRHRRQPDRADRHPPQLNAPWGIALAPASSGPFGGDLLIGNFGDGQINAYAPQPDGSWQRAGGLRDATGHQITIEGLWVIGFGNNGAADPSTTLYFAAGPDDEADGLFGSITAN